MDQSQPIDQAFETPGLADRVAEAIEEQRWPEEFGAFWEANRYLLRLHGLTDTLTIDVWYAMRIKDEKRPDWHRFLPLARKVSGLDLGF